MFAGGSSRTGSRQRSTWKETAEGLRHAGSHQPASIPAARTQIRKVGKTRSYHSPYTRLRTFFTEKQIARIRQKPRNCPPESGAESVSATPADYCWTRKVEAVCGFFHDSPRPDSQTSLRNLTTGMSRHNQGQLTLPSGYLTPLR